MMTIEDIFEVIDVISQLLLIRWHEKHSGGTAVETSPISSSALGDEAAFREFHAQYFDNLIGSFVFCSLSPKDKSRRRRTHCNRTESAV